MNKPEYDDEFLNLPIDATEKIKINTGKTTYSFTQDWVENEALKDVLVGLIADDLNKQL